MENGNGANAYDFSVIVLNQEILNFITPSVVRLLDFHNRSSKIIVQEFSIDDRL